MNSLQDTVYKYTTRMFLIDFNTNLTASRFSCFMLCNFCLGFDKILDFIHKKSDRVSQKCGSTTYELQTNCNIRTFQVRICSPVFHSHCLKSKLLLAVTQNWKILKSDNYKRELLSTGHLWGVTFIKLKIPCHQDLQQSSL